MVKDPTLMIATVLFAALTTAVPAAATSEDARSAGTTGHFVLGGQATRVDQRPAADKVGGFQLSLIGGVQLRGSASGQFGVALAYFKSSTAAVGVEVEAVFTQGPNGKVYTGVTSLILQSGARASRMVPYFAIGLGYFRAEENLRDAVADALPGFGIPATNRSETGGLLAFGFGIRYFMAPNISFRFDLREFKLVTSASGNIFDRLFSMRRIAGFLSFDF